MSDSAGNLRRGQRWPESPDWSQLTRLWVATLAVVVLALAWWSLRQFTSIVVIGVLLAYILNPLIHRLGRRAHLRRTAAAVVVYSTVAVAMLVSAALVVDSLADSMTSGRAQRIWHTLTQNLASALPDRIELLGQTVGLEPLARTLSSEMEASLLPAGDSFLAPESVGPLLGVATDFATGFLFTAFGLLVTFFVSLYVAIDGPRHLEWLEAQVPSGYRPAYRAILGEIDGVWRSFFRGQLLLAVIVGGVTALGLQLLGVAYALPLGFVAGVLEVVPRLGPTLSVVPAVAVALVVPSATLPGLPTLWFVLLVVALYIAIQQVENHLLVPRIMGSCVNLPPAVVLVGALAGARLAGVPGILLAAPVLGTARVVGGWVYSKLLAVGHGARTRTPEAGIATVDADTEPPVRATDSPCRGSEGSSRDDAPAPDG